MMRAKVILRKFIRLAVALGFLSMIFLKGGISNQELEYSGEENSDEANSTKYILLYTKFWAKADWWMELGFEALKECPVNNCYITNNRSYFANESSFDAVVFNCGNNHEIKRPMTRSEHQRYVFYCRETPKFFPVSKDLNERVRDFFNWTMTYRRDSDVYIPFGSLLDKPSGPPYPSPEKKEKLVAWLVSHCSTNSKRENYVKELAKYVPVDIYGKCGQKCPSCTNCSASFITRDKCEGYIQQTYKFYLAFENTVCNDYISEKFYRTLEDGLVPIVYGGGDYSTVVPEHTVININDYPNPEDLAKYLLQLHKNHEEYKEYLEWRNTFTARANHNSELFCGLCQALHADLPKKSYADLHEWNSKDQCPDNQVHHQFP